jgi:uncharacterized membrane protein YfcA
LNPQEISILASAAFATSILSAVVGMAGGLILLSVMLLFFDPLVAIPLHGVIQLVSNGSRTLVQRAHVRWSIIGSISVLLLPMSIVGLHIARALSPPVARLLIGGFVLIATWAPALLLLGSHPERSEPRRRFLLLGGVVGVVNMTVGAAGSLVAPFFLNLGLSRQAIIGTKAASQALGHLVKIAVFGFAGFAYPEYAPLLALLCAIVVAGTWIGSRLLEYVSDLWFTRLYKTTLTLVALRLVIGEILGFFSPIRG